MSNIDLNLLVAFLCFIFFVACLLDHRFGMAGMDFILALLNIAAYHYKTKDDGEE